MSMSNDNSDLEDDKSNVLPRSAMDAASEGLTKDGKKRRGRPPKYPTNSHFSASTSSYKRSKKSEPKSEEEEEEDDEMEEETPSSIKKRKRETDDEEWDEEKESLSRSQRRTRKKPTLYADEQAQREEEKRRRLLASRPKKGRPLKSSYSSPMGPMVNMGNMNSIRTPPTMVPTRTPTYNKIVVPQNNFSEKEKEDLNKMRQIWRDIQNPAQAKARFLPLLRRAKFEETLEKIMPLMDSKNPDNLKPKMDLFMKVQSVFDELPCSAGFREFLKNLSEAAFVAFYGISNALFSLRSDVHDEQAVAQSIRFWWNSLSFATRRKWEEYARKLSQDAHRSGRDASGKAIAFEATEVSIGHVSEERLELEKEWENRRNGPLILLEETSPMIECPLCEKGDDSARLRTIRDIQDHFFHYHWQVHGYACQFCGQMYPTVNDLMIDHKECSDWTEWRLGQILSQKGFASKLSMTHAKMLLCCAECGWHMSLSKTNRKEDELATMHVLKAFLAHHHNDSLLSMLVYFPGPPNWDLESVKFTITSMAGGDLRDRRNIAQTCLECIRTCSSKYDLREHQMKHVHDNSYFADYLTNSARILPPAVNMTATPKCGWKDHDDSETRAFGGKGNGVLQSSKGYTLISPNEEVIHQKTLMIQKRKMEGAPAYDGGFENAASPDEPIIAKIIREKFTKKYSEKLNLGELTDEQVWMTDKDAVVLKDYMDYWESPDGRKRGGPQSVECQITLKKVASVEVELHFGAVDAISGFLLNDNVYYCMNCDIILKGKQASEHLYQKDDEINPCAVIDGKVEQDPVENMNMISLFSPHCSPPSSSLKCPHCDEWEACSITGLRVHVMLEHGIFVGCTKVQGENVTDYTPLTFDIRSDLARTIDVKLKMTASGMLEQISPIISDPSVISDITWTSILHTRDNTDPLILASMEALAEADKMNGQMAPVPVINSHKSSRSSGGGRGGGTLAQAMAPYGRPLQIHSSAHQPQLTFEQQLQMKNLGRGRGGMSNSMTPMGRQPVSFARRGGAVMSQPLNMGNNMMRTNGASGNPRRRHLAEFHGSAAACGACGTGDLQTPDMVKGHLLRSHLYTCGHCTATFVYENSAKEHAKMCRQNRDRTIYNPDPRLPHMRCLCPYCSEVFTKVEMNMHLLDRHMPHLEFETPSGRLIPHIRIQYAGAEKQPEVERLRFKYYVPSSAVAQNAGYRQCHVCGLLLPDAAKLSLHLRHHCEFMYFCWICPRVTSHDMGCVSDMVRHIISFHLKDGAKGQAEGQLACPNCKMQIANRPLMHFLYDCNQSNMCQLCRDLPIFESDVALQEHKDKVHYDTLRRFECSDCGEYFATTGDYNKHECDERNMKTQCMLCPMIPKSRALFHKHFGQEHAAGEYCKSCKIKCRPGDWLNHVNSHGKTVYSTQMERHLLICAYGNQSVEQKTLLTHISNASFRLKGLAKVSGGTQDAPVVLSDDDDDDIVIEEITEEKSAAPAANGTKVQDDAEIVKRVVKTLVNQAVANDEKRIAEEKRARIAEETRKEQMPMDVDVTLDDDDDIQMIEDTTPSTAATTTAGDRNLSARVREEAEDEPVAIVGGQNLPGYKDDDEDRGAADGAPAQPIIREFAPDDDDLCVVAEVENTGCATAAATINKQREKKFQCPKCSSKFITAATLNEHLQKAHVFDAGHTTIMEELGIPRKPILYICKSCCLAFPTPESRKQHAEGHGQKSYGCETCSGAAYNMEVMTHHHKRVQEGKVAYVCGQCMLEFDHDISLHEHNKDAHGVALFYFCKTCEIGSTEPMLIYDHFMTQCPNGYVKRIKTMGPRAQEEAPKCIGVCPANQLHYQPKDVGKYKQRYAQNPGNYIMPSLCNHRSLCVAMERQVSCDACKCLQNIQRHASIFQVERGIPFEERKIQKARQTVPPLLYMRLGYDAYLRDKRQREFQERQHQINQANSQNMMLQNPSMMDARRGVIVTPGDAGRAMMPGFEDAQRAHNERMQVIQAARGGARMVPHLTNPMPHMQNGGQNLMRGPAGSPVQQWGGPPPPRFLQQQQMHHQPPPQLQPMMMPGQYQQQQPYQPLYPTQGQPPQGQYRVAAVAPTVHSRYDPRFANQPTVTRATHSTMGSLQSIAAAATGHQDDGLIPGSGPGPSRPRNAPPAVPRRSNDTIDVHCKFCGQRLTNEREVFIHSHHHSDRVNYLCSKCPIGIKTEKDAVSHIVNHMDPISRQLDMDMDCPFTECGKYQPSIIALRGHIAHHNPPLKYRAKNCCYLMFGSAALAKAHDEAHQASRREECCVLCGTMDNWTCEMTDKKGKELTIKHIMMHAFKHRYYCKICMNQFEEENQMVTHYIMNHMNDVGTSRCCNECRDANMRHENDYKLHCMEKHTIIELFQPERMVITLAQTFTDYLGIGLKE